MRFECLYISLVFGDLRLPQFSNAIYPYSNYTGSRVLETNYTSNRYVDVLWTQSACVDMMGDVYLAHTNRHSIIRITNESLLSGVMASEGKLYAGSDMMGYLDGTVMTCMLDSPRGIGVYETATNKFLYVADTGNHVIRRINVNEGTMETIAGMPMTPGLRDGDGRRALFRNPTSIGIDPISGMVFVLDNQSVIRRIEVSDSEVVVSTLVDGACRAINSTTTYISIISRTVRCQYEWLTNTTGSTQPVDTWVWPTYCVGRAETCSTRYDEL